MEELDFTIEFNSQGLNDQVEAAMFAEADSRLRELAGGHDDLTGAAINVRRPAKTETSFIYEVTAVVYARPKHIAATEKEADPIIALKNSLNAVERQVRKKREKLRDSWEQPGNDPISQDVIDVLTGEEPE